MLNKYNNQRGEALLNIMFCGDSNAREGIFLSALSICKNTSQDINIYILTASIDKYRAINQDFADKIMQNRLIKRKKGVTVTIIDMTETFGAYLPLANMATRFTPLCMLRLFADTAPQIPDKILYLDADVMCRKDFGDMYDLDISQYEIAGVPDRYGKWFFGNIFKHSYLNSGVLLMNMKKIRQSGLFQRCRELCREKKLFMPDQSALNKLAEKRTIPSKYNSQGKIKEDTVFKHFTTYFKFFPYIRAVTVKPWHTEKLHDELKIYEFDDILDEYKRSDSYE